MKYTRLKNSTSIASGVLYLFIFSMLNIAFFPTVQQSLVEHYAYANTKSSLLELILEDCLEMGDRNTQHPDEENETGIKAEHVFVKLVLIEKGYTECNVPHERFYESALKHPVLEKTTPPPKHLFL